MLFFDICRVLANIKISTILMSHVRCHDAAMSGWQWVEFPAIRSWERKRGQHKPEENANNKIWYFNDHMQSGVNKIVVLFLYL